MPFQLPPSPLAQTITHVHRPKMINAVLGFCVQKISNFNHPSFSCGTNTSTMPKMKNAVASRKVCANFNLSSLCDTDYHTCPSPQMINAVSVFCVQKSCANFNPSSSCGTNYHTTLNDKCRFRILCQKKFQWFQLQTLSPVCHRLSPHVHYQFANDKCSFKQLY